MSVEKCKRGYRLRFRPFEGKLVNLVTKAETKTEAMRIERDLTIACRIGDYRNLDPVAREAAIRLFHNQSWQLPIELRQEPKPVEELTDHRGSAYLTVLLSYQFISGGV